VPEQVIFSVIILLQFKQIFPAKFAPLHFQFASGASERLQFCVNTLKC